jgi:hypothetical protein
MEAAFPFVHILHPHYRLHPLLRSGQALRPPQPPRCRLYFTDESFEYQYDAVGNRTAHAETTLAGTNGTTYTDDAANHHLGTYGWDDRGNLVSDSTCTYIYNSAGWDGGLLEYKWRRDHLRLGHSLGAAASAGDF